MKIGAIRKLFKKDHLLLMTYVDDNSSLKSRFPLIVKVDNKERTVIGKGFDSETKKYLRLCIHKKSIYYMRKGVPFVIFGYGRFCECIENF